MGLDRSFRPHTLLTPTQDSTDSEMKEIAQEPRIGLLERTPPLQLRRHFQQALHPGYQAFNIAGLLEVEVRARQQPG